jgi:predicted signal transduction protein with EAL and GGDEF domain
MKNARGEWRWVEGSVSNLLHPSWGAPSAIVPQLEACRQARSWQSRRGDSSALFVAVNLSAKQLEYPNIVEEVQACLTETELASRDLTLEITESMLMSTPGV